ncbi:MAG: heavy-metal-associated domain-containing protein [Alicyclobacillus shizuokensis]|nr:heavy-metal-associated domain-containing protein [Alicyclobacillus shizuokensis]
MATATITVKGMTCSGCVHAVTRALQAIDGVQKADVDLARECATVTYDAGQISVETLRQAIEEAGYDAL